METGQGHGGAGKRRRPVFPVVIVLIIVGLLGYTGFTAYMKAKYAGMGGPGMGGMGGGPGVIVAAVEKLPLADRISAIGTAHADEDAVLTAKVTEKVRSINFEEGQFVKAGTVLVQLDDAAEQATLNEASRSYDRYKALSKSSAASVARRDEEEASMLVARAAVKDRQIVAPFDGIVGLRQVSAGDLVTPGMEITTIDAVDPIKLEFTVPETFLAALKPGMEIEARTEAFPDETFSGTVTAIDSRVNPQTRAITAKADIQNADGRLRPGLLMSVDIIRDAHEALVVPELALVSLGERQFVMTVDAEGKAVQTPIETGVRRPGFVEVLSGLKEGDKIIVEGLLKAHPGTPVQVQGEKTIAGTIGDAWQSALPRKREAIDAQAGRGVIPEPEKPEESKPAAGQPAGEVIDETKAPPMEKASPETAPEQQPSAEDTEGGETP